MDEPANKATSDKDSPKRIVQTLIFFDLETTGLPFSVGKKNVQITELSLVAVDRTEFENSENVRIINKLSLTVRPRSSISFEAIHMTGLCNTSLQFQEYFSPTTAQLLQLFLQRLNQPVCLLAHNGRRFDFPVLQAELKNVGVTLGDSVYCADTIDAFREIITKQNSVEMDSLVTDSSMKTTVCHPETICATKLENGNMQHQTSVNNEVPHANTTSESGVQYYDVNALTNDCIDELLCQEMEIFENLKSNYEPNILPLAASCTSTSNGKKLVDCNDNNASVYTDNLSVSYNSQLNEKTPLNKTAKTPVMSCRYKIPEMQAATPLTPNNNNKKDHSSARRKLFSCGDSVAVTQSPMVKKTIGNKKNKMSFSLQSLYHHFFNSELPLAHYAEGDCMSLMKISRELKDFLPWVDENMILLNNVQPLW